MRRHTPVRNRADLRDRLDQLVASFDVSHLEPDPLQLVREYADPLDQETSGIIAAAFAYGRADIVVSNVRGVLARMGTSPYRYLRDEFTRSEATRRFRNFSHRFHKTPELVGLLAALSDAIRKHGSLGELFRECYQPAADDIGPSLSRFVSEIISGHEPAAALQYLLTSPEDGSACKRMNLYLRWMVRSEEPDLGLWNFVAPAKLVMPLDTHVHRITTFLGLNRRKSGDWKSARALTDALARFSNDDPVRYDYAICRLGILDRCSRRRSKENCDSCLLRDVCRFPVT